MSYPEVKTFWIDPSGVSAQGARRYVRESHAPDGSKIGFTCKTGFHSAIRWLGTLPTTTHIDKDGTRFRDDPPPLDPDAGYWPTHCACGYEFAPDDTKQTFALELYRLGDDDTDHGPKYVLPGYGGTPPPQALVAPPGAMWHAYWLPSAWRGEDGIALAVCLPNRNVWLVDSQASNCTRPGEDHKCWVRHGDPRSGDITVDKDGETCSAGAGSIQSGDYHGFLRAGALTTG